MRESSTYLIYGLVDPRDSGIFYVGKSCSGLRRPRQHWNKWSLRLRSHTANKIRQVIASGAIPKVTVLEELSSPVGLDQAEVFWIGFLRRHEWQLTNLTDGGGGCLGWTPPAEWRAKLAARMSGRVVSAETRARLSAAHAGRKPSADAVAKMAKTKTGSRHTPEARRKVALARLGKKHSAETRMKMSIAIKAALKRRREERHA